MGWSKGKGLGANEDGITEHVKVSYKHDSKGIYSICFFSIIDKFPSICFLK